MVACLGACRQGEIVPESPSSIMQSESKNDTASSDETSSAQQEVQNNDKTEVESKTESQNNASANNKPTVSSKPSTNNKPTTSSKPNTNSKPAISTSSNTVSAKQQALSKAKAKADAQNYLEAMQILKQYLSSNSKDNTVSSKLTEYEDKYAQQQIEKSEGVFNTPETDYVKALNIIKEAIKNAPDNSRLKTKKEYYLSFEPKDVTTFKQFDNYNMLLRDSEEDLLGNIHYGVMYRNGWVDDKGYVCYVLDGTYNKLTFTYYGGSASWEDGALSIRDISSGDYDTSTMIFEKNSISSSALPKEVTIDISGVKIIRFWCSECTVLADAVVQRTVK